MLRTTLMPRPPPPCAALKIMGSPCSWANFFASATSLIGLAVPGMTLRPASIAAFLASVLFPIRNMTSGEGPTKRMPFSKQALANSPDSDNRP
ncbi:hypothetical protein BpHYR1_009074 [Brachionus plicatilis]|uniref:Uncharacterized protein n=1 Tax=Brachionus plicatilis TaxID=10195 RepID=A0A3M7QMT2_BRAPC|nr:hypothetical protein BpHYR1_009074 [Brachionus plicatilis]